MDRFILATIKSIWINIDGLNCLSYSVKICLKSGKYILNEPTFTFGKKELILFRGQMAFLYLSKIPHLNTR